MSNTPKPIPDETLLNLVQQHLVNDDSSSVHSHPTPESPIDSSINIPYHLPGAAITHDIYTHANSLVQQSHSLSRSRSLTDLNNPVLSGPNQNSAENEFENLDKPGGFRRFHVQQQHKLATTANALPDDYYEQSNTSAFEELFRPDSVCSSNSKRHYGADLSFSPVGGSSSSSPQPYQQIKATQHFLEFLSLASVINQFAGEYLSDEDEEQSDEERPSEATALLPRRKSLGRRQSSMREQHKANVTKTIFLLFKAFIGSGILFLPKAFSNGGLMFSIVFMWFMGGISLYCFLLLLDCKKVLVGSYGDMGEELYGPWMRRMVLFSIAISQLGFMCGGTIFIVQNVTEAIRSLSHDKIHISSIAVFILLAIFLIPLVMIRNIAKLSPTALLSDVLIVGGLIVLLAYDVVEIFGDEITLPKTGPEINWIFNSANFSVFVGTAVYSFEGIGLIIPIRDSMEKPEKFPAVLTFVMVFVASILCAVGTLGYIAFGKDVQTIALLNLPTGVLPSSIQLGYAVAVLLSNALALFPTIRIIEQGFFGERTGKFNSKIKWEKNMLRASIVIAGTLIAWAGANDLDKFISLIGSVCCCPLSLIFPPLFHLALPDTKGIKRITDLILITFGFVVMMFTFFNTANQWATSG